MLAVTVILRGAPSIMTCIRNRNYFSTKETSSCGECICAIETIFYIMAVINFIVLILGTYTTFVEPKPDSCFVSPSSAPNCCDSYVYVTSAIFSAFQYLLYASTGLFVCISWSCIKRMDDQMNP